MVGRLFVTVFAAAFSLYAQTSPAEPPDLAKLERYAANGMWDEALAMLRNAVSADEFNPNIRFSFGQVLLKTGQFEEAAKQLAISRRLDARNWRVLEGLAAAHLRVWEGAGGPPHRTEACSLYSTLSSWPADSEEPNPPHPLVALFAVQPDTLSAAGTRARQTVKALDHPEGTWQDSRGKLYDASHVSDGWLLEDKERASENRIQLSISAPGTTGHASGRGLYRLGECALTVTVQVMLSECSSKAAVEMVPTGGWVWVGRSDNGEGQNNKGACQILARNLFQKFRQGNGLTRELTRIR